MTLLLDRASGRSGAEAKAAGHAPAAKVRRPHLALQVALVAFVVLGYDVVNSLAATRASAALRHGSDVLHLERLAGLAPEAALNAWLAAHHLVAVVADYYYDLAHFLVTFPVLAALWWMRPHGYRRMRDALLGANVVGFVVFWLAPVAPPRLLPDEHFVDTVAAFHTIGSWHTGALASTANQYAAMPSLHVGWAVWSAFGLWMLAGGRRWVRALAVAYPLLTVGCVLATGNHYLLDAFAGLATALASLAVATLVDRVRTARQQGRGLTLRPRRTECPVALPDRLRLPES